MPEPYEYTYLFASEADRLPVGYLRKLKKKYVKAVLRDLRHTARFAYVLLKHLPESHFSVIRTCDYRHEVGAAKHWYGDELFSLREFLHYAGLFHPNDLFRVRFCEEVFEFEQEFNPHTLERLCGNYLESFCKLGLERNAPLCRTCDPIREYALTQTDAKIIRQCSDAFNATAAKKQAEYEVPKTPDRVEK